MAAVAPMDRPHSTNLLNPTVLKWASMQSLRTLILTNVLLLFDPVGHSLPLALAAPRKVEGTESHTFRDAFEDVGALESIRAVAMHEDNTGVGVGLGARPRVGEEGGVEGLVGGVGKSNCRVLYVPGEQQVF